MSSPSSFSISRTFAARRSDVFRLWTDPELVAKWWGIEGSTIPVCELDVRVGGRWHIEMRTASGKVYPNGGEYLEVVPFERLVYSDEPDPSISEWNGDLPQPSTHMVTFEENRSQTNVTLHVAFASSADRDRLVRFGMETGLQQSLDRLTRVIEQLALAQI